MIKVLFLIPNLGHGGAEKVLVNLVNNMDKSKFDVTVMTLYDEGVNKSSLCTHIKYKTVFKHSFFGISHLFKLLTPKLLYKLLIREQYNIVVSYLEGTTARIVSGCPDKNTKLISWIHVEQHSAKNASRMFRSVKEMKECYRKFDSVICVSQFVKDDFLSIVSVKNCLVLYNTVESDLIKMLSNEKIEDTLFSEDTINLCCVGTLKKSKGVDRLLRVHKKLLDDGFSIHTYILGEGEEEDTLKLMSKKMDIDDSVSFLGYKINPYKYIKKCQILVCSSFAEGFSTAVTEALILGVPVCTVDVSGMRELLGMKNEFGIVVDNDENALFLGIKSILEDKKKYLFYKQQSECRGKFFNTSKTVKEVELFFEKMIKEK